MTPLQRRQFGKLVAASLTSTVVADISSKAFAQKTVSSNESLYGVNVLSTSNTRNRENQTPPVELNTATLPIGKVISANLLDQKVLSKVNLPVFSVENLSPVPKKPRAFFFADSDRITKAIVLEDKTLVISTVSNTRNGQFNHLIYSVGSATNRQFRAKKVLDFKSSNQTIESLLSLPNNKLLCIVAKEGIPPFALITLDFRTGKILSGDELSLPSLPPNHRFANLCQDAKGNIFATEIGSEGIPILISMNLQEKAIITGKVKIKRLTRLTFEGRPLVNDVKDLGFSASGQLYALATDSSRKNNVLYTVDVKTGKMELVKNFAVEKFVFSL
ncbi:MULTISPECIES: hypothetical protein [unclassified Nostoc]|uniref:hypothetical protein n=1 Tax=unclassified Nostoc TaxID=2593658 RepID=UPI000CF30200|nr:hypothetical protein [Nostoc sp. 'Peltigera membranacea cyanobiont' N6]AVH62363.1 hypothetical protein NPM_0489 [Nostoc sp. 'Peltigera membranacea cyanobiont' N6]